MTGRNSGGVGPRTGLTGIMAAATILAASLLGLAWAAQQDKPGDKKSHQQGTQGTQANQPTPKAPDTTGARPVTRSIGGATVAVDPATGRLIPPTPEEQAKLTAALYRMVSRETEDLVIIQTDSGLMAALDESFQEVAMASRDKKGNLRLHCVDTPAQAEKVLSGGADKGPIYNVRADRKASKKAGKNAPAPAETE